MEIYIPENQHVGQKKILAISAHQDDIELMAYSGIHKAYSNPDYGFTAVVCSDGRNSPRIGEYADYTDEMMIACRRKEQIAAAELGRYETLYMLNKTSEECKTLNEDLIEKITNIILEVKPEILLTHNPMDKHDTHVGVFFHVLEALRRINKKFVPQQVLGCEVWRGLDWLNDEDKVILDCGDNSNLQLDLLNVFVSQVVGGKRYDTAGVGRRYANATFFASHACDNYQMINYAVDIKPLVLNENASVSEYCLTYINKFKDSVMKNLKD